MMKTARHLVGFGLVAAFCIILSACGGPSRAQIGNEPGADPNTKEIDKAISTPDDQTRLAFSELQWNLEVVNLSIHPPATPEKKNCVSYKPNLKLMTFLTVSYSCTRASDASDPKQGRRFDFSGDLLFSDDGGSFNVTSRRLVSKSSKAGGAITAQGMTTRTLTIRKPAGSSQTFAASGTTAYQSTLPVTKGQPIEKWTVDFKVAFDSASDQSLTLVRGSTINVSALTETTLTAQNDVHFQLNGNCLRPVGSFVLTTGEGDTASDTNIVATSSGYTRSDDGGKSHPWGAHCLER